MTIYLTDEQIEELVKSSEKIIEKINTSKDEFKELIIKINNFNVPVMSGEEVGELIKNMLKKVSK